MVLYAFEGRVGVGQWPMTGARLVSQFNHNRDESSTSAVRLEG